MRSILPYLRAEQENETLKKEEQERKPAPPVEKKIDPELVKYMAPEGDDEMRLKSLLEDLRGN